MSGNLTLSHLEATPGPLVTVSKGVDARPGRKASSGDGMATLHQRFLGGVGAIVEATVRDLNGIRGMGLSVWKWGTLPRSRSHRI
jgi:regulator of RNase E activity RraA